jgi:hypothetical protein
LQNVLSRHDQPIAFSFALDRTPRTRLSYFFACIDFAPSGAEIGHWIITDRFAKFDRAALPTAKAQMARWNNPHEWLLKKAQQWNADELYDALRGLAYRLNGDSIQGLFQSEMDADGYFDKKAKSNANPFDAESWGSHRWHT